MYTVVLSTEPSFDFQSVARSHGWMQLPPYRWHDEYQALEYVWRGKKGVSRMWMHAHKYGLAVGQPDAETVDDMQHDMWRGAEGMLGINRDLTRFYTAMRAHEGYGWIEAVGHWRILACPTAWEDLAKILLTTNCSWAYTTQMSRRLCALGEPHPTIEGLHAFPTPRHIANMSGDELAESVRAGYRTAWLHELARKIADGEIEPERWRWLDADDMYKAVRSLKGFGDYAAATFLRLSGRHGHLAIDSAARGFYAERFNDGEPAADDDIRERYARFGEWQGLVLWLDMMRHYRETA